MKNLLWSCLAFLASITSFHGIASANSEIEINGERAQVFFNDGDTFRIVTGQLAGKRSRLAGFNTLESYGPVHRWGAFKSVALKNIADEATRNARRDGWHCITGNSTDTYGRLLSVCMDLAVDQVEKGLAHVMTVTSEPADSKLVRAQEEAIRNGRGMWALGVPEFILTSLHSLDETPNQKETYNRFVSTKDGHSVIVVHKNTYKDCEEVCESPSTGSALSTLGEKSCMTYVGFKNRFGPRRAACLKK